jgi:putative ABC transport system substrate-binding protein
MNRRDLMVLIGGAAAWPLAVRAQQPAVPVIGWLSGATSESDANILPSFRQALNAQGFVEGRNVTIEYRWAEGQIDRLPALATDLVRRNVAVIVANSNVATLAAKAATATTPIVFITGSDPVKLGMVASFNRPSGNVTGISFLTNALTAKRLEVLHDLVPAAEAMSMLVNLNNPSGEQDINDTQAVARALGLQVHILKVGTEFNLESAFAELARERSSALLVSADGFFTSRRDQIVAMSASRRVPTIYPRLEYVSAGGLIAYAARVTDVVRQAGIYVGRILKGEKPSDLPVQQPTKFELGINLKTAKALGLTVPPALLSRADEVIE